MVPIIMPIYAFHLDVPATPEVIAERLRSVVRAKRGFWESIRSAWSRSDRWGPPFVGTVQATSFRLRRDIHYRNSFLPLIRGRTIPTVNGGSRVNVTMFVHPLTLIFMIFWFGVLGFTGWNTSAVNQTASMSFLGMFIFGLALIIGGFFPEALKAKRLLSGALFDSAIQSTVRPNLGPKVDVQPEGLAVQRWLGRFAIVGAVLLIASLVANDLYARLLRSNAAYSTALQLALNSQEVKSTLGEPVQVGRFPLGRVKQIPNVGYALLSIPLHGSRATGTLYVVANRTRRG
jgi:cytochrome oxidase complex assembly protein 1